MDSCVYVKYVYLDIGIYVVLFEIYRLCDIEIILGVFFRFYYWYWVVGKVLKYLGIGFLEIILKFIMISRFGF